MDLIFKKTRKKIVKEGVICPVCARMGNVVEDGEELYEVWCTRCRNWFEMGFQIHSGE